MEYLSAGTLVLCLDNCDHLRLTWGSGIQTQLYQTPNSGHFCHCEMHMNSDTPLQVWVLASPSEELDQLEIGHEKLLSEKCYSFSLPVGLLEDTSTSSCYDTILLTKF